MRLLPLAALVVLSPVMACVSIGGLSGGQGSDGGSDGSTSTDAGSDAGAVNDTGAAQDSPGLQDADATAAPDAAPDAATDADAAPTIPPGLVVWLRMEEPSGSNAGNAADPTLNASGTATVASGAPGKIGRGFSFTGAGGLTIADPGVPSRLDFTTAVTIELWMKPDAADQGCGLVSKETNGTPLTGYTVAQNSSGGYFFWDVRADTRAMPVALNGSLAAGAWTHVAATYDGATARLYKDGKFVTSLATTGPIRVNSQPLSIGQSDYGAFKGVLDEVKLWNVVRSEAEICADAGGVYAATLCTLP